MRGMNVLITLRCLPFAVSPLPTLSPSQKCSVAHERLANIIKKKTLKKWHIDDSDAVLK